MVADFVIRRATAADREAVLRVAAAGIAGGVIGETGTGCGVGLAWMASAVGSETRLVSVEIDATRAAACQAFFAALPNVTVLHGDWRMIAGYGPLDAKAGLCLARPSRADCCATRSYVWRFGSRWAGAAWLTRSWPSSSPLPPSWPIGFEHSIANWFFLPFGSQQQSRGDSIMNAERFAVCPGSAERALSRSPRGGAASLCARKAVSVKVSAARSRQARRWSLPGCIPPPAVAAKRVLGRHAARSSGGLRWRDAERRRHGTWHRVARCLAPGGRRSRLPWNSGPVKGGSRRLPEHPAAVHARLASWFDG